MQQPALSQVCRPFMLTMVCMTRQISASLGERILAYFASLQPDSKQDIYEATVQIIPPHSCLAKHSAIFCSPIQSPFDFIHHLHTEQAE